MFIGISVALVFGLIAGIIIHFLNTFKKEDYFNDKTLIYLDEFHDDKLFEGFDNNENEDIINNEDIIKNED